ncbi:MAG: ABC transporter ATP-binding protein [Bacilli bacterium]|nr:ABC transporter ATP-binding protein [Bacilli bacterium]
MSEIFNTINRNLTRIIADIGIFIVILIINKIAFLYLVFMLFIYYFIERKRVCIKTENDKVIRKKSEKVSGFIGELVRGVRDLKMLNAEDSFTRQLDDEVIDLNKARYLQGSKDREYILIRDSFLNFSDTGLIFLLVFLISSHQLELTSGLVIYNYMGKLTSIVSSFSTLLEKVKDFDLSASRIFSIMDDQVFKKESFGDQKIEKVKGNFEFKEVTFSYQDHKKVLDQLSFKINCNTTTAFVGKSGAGKSTIFNLLCKMYDYNQGLITIDGVDIKQLDKDTIRGNITIISQNPYIFHMSIRKNLELVKSDMTEKEMKEACRIACLDEFINTLPDSYDTIVGEGGTSFEK